MSMVASPGIDDYIVWYDEFGIEKIFVSNELVWVRNSFPNKVDMEILIDIMIRESKKIEAFKRGEAYGDTPSYVH